MNAPRVLERYDDVPPEARAAFAYRSLAGGSFLNLMHRYQTRDPRDFERSYRLLHLMRQPPPVVGLSWGRPRLFHRR